MFQIILDDPSSANEQLYLSMDQKNNSLLYHRRASSQNVHNRKSCEKNNQYQSNDQMGKLNKEQEQLLRTVKEMTDIDDRLTKIDKIRISQWTEKLSSKPNNAVWRKNINFYLKILVQMINQQEISAPFSTVPVEGSLPNLKLLDLPFPIREKITQKEKIAIFSNNKMKNRQSQIGRHNDKAKSINFKENLHLDIEDLDRNVKINHVAKQRKHSSIKSCQVSEKRVGYIVKEKDLKLKLTADHNKQNNFLFMNNSNVTRRLFENEIEKSQKNDNTLLTYKNQECQQMHNTTVCSFQGLDLNKSTKANKGISLLLKVYELIQKNGNLDEQAEAQAICLNINKIAHRMGISLANDSLNQSTFSTSSVTFRKASENIRLKFVETDEQTLQFMSFLHKFRVEKQ